MGSSFSLRNSIGGVQDGELAKECLEDEDYGADEDQYGKNGGDEGCGSFSCGWF